ncbi:hypothetical protein ACLMJK_009385 [Lecanora helva]
MAPSTRNSTAGASSTPPDRPNRRVSFAIEQEQEQEEAAANARAHAADARKKRADQNKQKAQELAEANRAARIVQKEQKEQQKELQKAMNRRERELKKREDALQRKEQEEARRRQREREKKAEEAGRIEEAYQRRLVRQDEEGERREHARRARISTDELIEESRRTSNLENEPPTPLSLARMRDRKNKEEGPFDYCVEASLKVQTNKIGARWYPGSFGMDTLCKEIHEAMDRNNIALPYEISGWVKSTASRATRRKFTLTALVLEQWDERVEPILREEWIKFLGHIIDVYLDCIGRPTLRRNAQAVEEPNNRRLIDVPERAVEKKFMRFIAIAMRLLATEHTPPVALYTKFITPKQDKPEKKSIMEGMMKQYAEIAEKRMEWDMAKEMRAMTASFSSQSQQQQQQQAYNPAPPPPYWPIQHYPPMQYAPQQYTQQQYAPQPPELQENHLRHPSPTPGAPGQRSLTNEQRPRLRDPRSSPISTASQGDDIMDQFWH